MIGEEKEIRKRYTQVAVEIPGKNLDNRVYMQSKEIA